MKSPHAAIAALGLLCLPALSAAEPAAETPVKREAVAVRVSTRGLDLNTHSGVARLRERMASAIAAACSPGNRLNTGRGPDWQCRSELNHDASVQLSAIGRPSMRRIASR